MLARPNSGNFLVELLVFGEYDEEKSRHAVTVDNRSEKEIVYDSLESHAMVVDQKVLKICSDLRNK